MPDRSPKELREELIRFGGYWPTYLDRFGCYIFLYVEEFLDDEL